MRKDSIVYPMWRVRAVCYIPKKTWISPESGIRSLPSKALSMTAGAEAVLGVLMAV
jgi:hypothetical protein